MLRYVTTNAGKVREAREYLDGVEQLDYDYTEVQAADLGPIAALGAREAYRHADEPVLVDDAGLFVEGFDGFPGPYSAYVEETLGVEAVQRLVAAEVDEPCRASFRCVMAYCDGDDFAATPDPVDREDRSAAAAAGADASGSADADAGGSGDADVTAGESGSTGDDPGIGRLDDPLPVKLFRGTVRGRIVEPRGEGGFGYDPIFEHEGTTFAEMSAAEKNAVSHRGRAFAKFAEWYQDR